MSLRDWSVVVQVSCQVSCCCLFESDHNLSGSLTLQLIKSNCLGSGFSRLNAITRDYAGLRASFKADFDVDCVKSC